MVSNIERSNSHASVYAGSISSAGDSGTLICVTKMIADLKWSKVTTVSNIVNMASGI